MTDRFKPRFFRISRNRHAPGFSLIVTISLMILLSLLAVGMLSLATISVRKSATTLAQTEARANARLALIVAMGELQKELGPDQRISARAEILDREPASLEADDVAHPQYLGVWESWNTWLTDSKGSLSIQDTYRQGRDPSLFRRWLVSNAEADGLSSALGGATSTDAVVMCGEGSAGEDPAGHVRVGKIPVGDGGRITGGYAWWIADESMKARLDLPERRDAESFDDARMIAGHTGRPGVETMESMGGFDTAPESVAKMITTGQAGISAAAARENFHDITAYSTGLLTDVRFGGFKRDLNLALESDDLPEEMQEIPLFGGRPFDPPIRPMTGELADISPQNPYLAPMSWRTLREYYRLHREFSDNREKHPVAWKNSEPVTQRFLMGDESTSGRWDTKGYTRLPILLRQTWIIATKAETNAGTPGGIEYYVLAVPVVSLWNPFDVAMEVDSEAISYMGSMFYSVPLVQRTYRGSNYLGETAFPDTRSSVWGGRESSNHNITANQLGYRMIPTESRGLIRFEPGEVRVFSTNDEVLHGQRLLDDPAAMNSRHFFASPGYEPVQESTPGVLRGLKARVHPGSGTGPLTIALRLDESDRQYDPFWIATPKGSAINFTFHEWRSADRGVYFEDGSLVGRHEWHDVVRLNTYSLDWLESGEVGSSWIVSDEPAYRAGWPAPGSPPLPIGIVSIVAKSPELLDYTVSGGFADDYRNRGWLHAPPTGMGALLMNPEDLNRADSAYQLHFTAVNGDQEVSQYLEADGPNGFYGGGYSRNRGQTHVTALDLPTTPIANLGSLAGVRMDPARARIDQRQDGSAPGASLPGRGYHNMKFNAHRGGAFGAGIGNAYAHPMINAGEVYTRNDLGGDPGWDGRFATGFAICDDYWDHLFLANEELWDSWFCSGIAPVVSRGQVIQAKEQVAQEFFEGGESPLSPHFLPYAGGKSTADLVDLVETTDAGYGDNGWARVGAHLLNQGQFNVNSTSKEAWKALFMSLANRPIAANDSGTSVIDPDSGEVTLSRLPVANSTGEADGPLDPDAWNGIRKLSEAEIDKLAEQVVRQVKARGPFLNMTEFINRRLVNDETGVTGALQAAIDWDEFEGGYRGTTSGSGASINAAYKNGDAMIGTGDLPARYPNPRAATGSRYAGIPGYVMQSDLLQGISASLSVRGDTFLIRSYGESLDRNGEVAARAWCEAVVQRMPDYVDPTNAADTPLREIDATSSDSSGLTPANQVFGRRFEMVSFRWMNEGEV